MRVKAKKILFETMKFHGAEELLFSTGKLSDKSGNIEIVIDAMMKFKNEKNEKNIKSSPAR